MGNIVRRVSGTPATNAASSAPAERTRQGGGIFVSSQLSLGVEPHFKFSWAVVPSYWAGGYSLHVFHSMVEFSREPYPADLSRHGQLIIETGFDGSHDQVLPEGSHYFTFLLYKRGFFGLSESMSMLRFLETVPSARVAVGRIKDQLDFQNMMERNTIGKIEHEAALAEAKLRRIQANDRLQAAENPKSRRSGRAIDEELDQIDAMLETLAAKRAKIREVKKDPKFQSLTPREQKRILRTIRTRLDPGEMSARREK